MLNLNIKINEFNVAFKYECEVSSYRSDSMLSVPSADRTSYHEIIDNITNIIRNSVFQPNSIEFIRNQIPRKLSSHSISIVSLVKLAKPKLDTLPEEIHQMIFNYFDGLNHSKLRLISRNFNRKFDVNQIIQDFSRPLTSERFISFLNFRKFTNIYKLHLTTLTPDLKNSILDFLHVDQCRNLIDLKLNSGQQNFTQLEIHSLTFLKKLQKLSLAFSQLTTDHEEQSFIKHHSFNPFPESLTELSLTSCFSAYPFASQNLTSLTLCNVTFNQNEPPCHFPHLNYLKLVTSELSFTSQTLSNLQILHISKYRKEKVNLNLLDSLKEIRDLTILCTDIEIPDQVSSKTLEILRIQYSNINNLDFLLNFPRLKELILRTITPKSTDFSVIFHLNQLETLSLSHFPKIDISPLASFTKLKNLSIDGTVIENFNGIENLNIEMLSLARTAQFSSLKPIMTLKKLKKLTLPDWFSCSNDGMSQAKEKFSINQIREMLLFLKAQNVFTQFILSENILPSLLKYM